MVATPGIHPQQHISFFRFNCALSTKSCSLRCPNATCVQTSAQYVPYRNHIETMFRPIKPYHIEAPLVCTIHGANLIIRIMSLCPFGPLTMPYPLCGRSIKIYARGNNNAPSFSKYGSLVRLDTQIVALRTHCAKCAVCAPLVSKKSCC